MVNEEGISSIWMSRDLDIISNSEFRYAICPIAIILVWNSGACGSFTSESLTAPLRFSRAISILPRLIIISGERAVGDAVRIRRFKVYRH